MYLLTAKLLVPAFLTLIIIPLTYKYVLPPCLLSHHLFRVLFSIAYGVIAGIISYILINGIAWALRKISGERLAPPNYDAAEPWVIPPGSIIPAWMYVFRSLLSHSWLSSRLISRRFIAGRAGFIDEPSDAQMEMHMHHEQQGSLEETSSMEQDKHIPTPVYEKAD